MKKWVFTIVLLLLQEVVTMNGVLLKAHQGMYSVWVIHGIFLVATCFDIVIGFWVGSIAKRKWTNKKVVQFADKWSEKFHTYAGNKGRKISLLLLGNFSFPYINAFIASWLNISFWESFIFLLLGNIISYATSWILVLGVTSLVKDPVYGLVAVIILSFIGIFIARLLKEQKV